MTIKIPNTDKKLIQTNRSNIFGNLWSTLNIDLFDNLGAIRLGKRLKLLGKTGDSGLTNLGGVPVGFTQFNNRIHCIAGTRIFYSDSAVGDPPAITFHEDNSTGARTDWNSDLDDMMNFNNTLCVVNSGNGKLYSLDAAGGSGTWTDRGLIVSGSGYGANQLTYFRKFDRLYVMDWTNNKINSVDTSWVKSTTAGSYSISFTGHENGGLLQCIAAGSDRIWIGFKRGSSGSADNTNSANFSVIAEWDGQSAQITKEYKIPSKGIMAIIMRNDVPVIMDASGILREFNGSGFSEIGRLPVYQGQSLLTTGQPYWTDNFIHPKGMVVTKEGTILAAINGTDMTGYNARTSNEQLPSGIWEFDGKGSAVHKHSFGYMPMSSTSVTDHGQQTIETVGSLAKIHPITSSAYGMNSYYCGAQYYTDATNKKFGIFADAPTPSTSVTYPEGQKYGYVVSTWIDSNGAVDMWQKMFIKFRQLLDSGDKIIGKYRFIETNPTIISITWVNTTSFTTATDVSAYVGYEVEILKGTGGGKCSHITAVTGPSGGLYTVTVDETYTGVTTGTATARIQNWAKAGEITTQQSEIEELPIGSPAQRIQVKICMQFTGDDEIREIAIINNEHQKMV